LRFFQDDAVEPNEASAGNAARIQLYDAPMTTTQVRLLDRVPNTGGGGDQPILFTTFRHGFGIAEIFTMNADGSNHKRLTFNEVADEGPKWSPDKSKIVYYRRESGSAPWQIWIMNADGSGQTRLTNTTTHDFKPAWKPDGSKILFSRCNSSFVCDLYTMNPDGSEQTLIPNGINTDGDEDHASFSPDATKIIFVCSTNTFANPNICTANADGTNRQQLTNTVSPVTYFHPVFSPNGAKIAFERRSNSADVFTADIYVMDSNGSNLMNLTNNTGIFDANPRWSPDGARILFQSQRESVYTEIYTLNSSNGSMVQRLTVNSVADGAWDWYRPAQRRTPFDFDGDGRADISVFRPADGVWYLLRSQAGFAAAQFGISTDKIVPADYDGDGKTDIAVYRNGIWYWLNSSNGAFNAVQFGIADDVPQPADFDGDGRAELAVYRGGVWFVLNLANGQFSAFQFGVATDKPVVGDYDGDGKADYTVYRPADGVWYMQRSQAGFGAVQFGIAADKPVPADYDGDGKTDQAVYRDGTWYLNRSRDGFAAAQFGLAADLPAPADYDGDGKTDLAVYRNNIWYLQQTTSGFAGVQFGTANDRPVPNAFVR
jgi:Tol biopolymer transport system component